MKTRLSRGQGLSLGAALTAVGITSIGNDISCIAAYGAGGILGGFGTPALRGVWTCSASVVAPRVVQLDTLD